ncbi:hypothetical protein DRE_05360 [Drechslerella stenobrocha 248]|uniref:Uncharacterized protein n=1 Tax=Drechslerella stenobrocha 248 TaxID=1043628 RepID=W7HZ84_9PEZI|nr:hypothetical protein DRE_05360 [Drechslerella stenobrocha 248]
MVIRADAHQTTVGRIYSNGNPVLDSTHLLPNSFASQMMAQESLRGRRGRPGRRASTSKSGRRDTANAFLWPVPIPPAAPGMEDAGPPAPPLKDSPKKAAMLMNPAMERMVYQSRFTEIYSPDTPTAPRLRGITEGADSDGDDDGDDGIFRRTLNLEGEGFWKLTGKRLSALGAAHRRRKSQDPSQAYPPTQPAHNRYNVDEEARVAMEQMGLYSPPSCAASAAGATDADRHDKETKGKGYVFDAPLPGTGSCEFETNSVGRKIRLRLHPPGTIAGSPFGNTAPVKPDPILLCTLSLQPPDALSQSSSGSGVGAGHSHSHSHSQSRASIKLNKLGERFKAKAGRLHRESSWTEHVEQEAGSGQRSKLGSLLIEGEGMDVLDLVVVSSMGVFWKRYCEWTEDLREGGL